RVYAAGDGVNYSNSGYSTIKAVKTKDAPLDPTPLTVPTWKTTSSTYNSVTVAWNPVTNASGYVVEYKGPNDTDYTVVSQTNATSITIPNLAAETTYKLRVYAAGDGISYSDSGYSTIKAVKTKAAPVTPEPASTVVTSLADTVNAYDNVVTLREAITVYANDGDTITFAPALKGGTITLGGSEIEINKSIKIDASALWDATQDAPGITIDANSQSRILHIAATDESGPIEVGIDSLAFAHGDAYLYYYQFGNDQYYYQNYSPYQYYHQCGGAILCVNRGAEPLLTISNSVFTENEGAAGAAIFFLAGSTLNISGSIFNNNGADDDGGAFFAQGARQTNVSDSIFEGNSSGNSGGAIVALDTTLNVAGTEFHDNSAWSGLAYENGGVGYGYGGAVMFEFGTLNVSNSVFYTNDSDAWGGAVNAANADVVIKNSTFTQNEAPLGSAISLHDQPFYWQEQYYYLNAKLFNVTISDNKTIPGNDSTGGSDDNRISGAIFFSGNVDTQLDVYNSIIAGNQNGDVRLDDNAEGSVNAYKVLSAFNDWSNGTAGIIGYDPSKPLFTNAAQGDYTLATGSQAINRGDNAYVTTQTDLAGAPRIIGGTVDLGAYESDTPAPSASLDVPTWKSTSSTYNSVTVAWNPVANASGYVVEYKGPTDTDYTVMPQTNATSITIPNLA
ncbi:MAG: fibronectin type III domain-containing protein, partial [Thermoguttaceae bacterium]|nr:fibronectin type III domain-containing protein [Thermoguttaceae bacterium]